MATSTVTAGGTAGSGGIRAAGPDPELIDRVAGSAGLTAAEAARVVQDVLAWYREPAGDYVRRRHAHHRARGRRNPEIFGLIAAELAGRVVAPPRLSQRQLRRIVYG